MYRVDLKLNDITYPIHNEQVKLISGQVKQGINSIDSFSFTILPNNIGFNDIRDFKTLISVYNEKRKKYEFQGRVLYSSDSMSSDGKINKSVVCESFLGYLQDSRQDYVYEQNWTGEELLTQLLNVHNSQTEEYKHFKVGNVFTTENIYVGIQRESTWKMVNEKILSQIGGEIQLRVEEDGMYIDIVQERGTTKATTIELSKNMLSITKDSDPSSYITRMIPLGAKLTDEDGGETEERVDITSVNNGLNYIDDVIAIEHYGIHIEYVYWDDVHEPNILLTKARNYLTENNKVLQKYKIDYVDLELIGLDIDSIDVCNYYPIKNKLLGIDEILRVITKTIDIVNITNTSVEIGDDFKTLTDLEIEKNNQLNSSINTIKVIEKNYVTNAYVSSVSKELYSYIDQKEDSITSTISETFTTKSDFGEYQTQISSQFQQTKEGFDMTFENVVKQITDVDGKVNTNYNELVKYIRFKGGTITLGEVDNPLTLTLSNDRMSFLQNGVEVAYISNNRLYIYDGEFLNSLKLGRWVWIIETNGSLSLNYIEEV